jgi:hypothetical protein
MLLRLDLADLAGERTVWLVATVDTHRGIVRLQDYAGEAAAAHDRALLASAPPPAPSAVTNLVPFLPVADVERSIACYGLLGFEQGDSYAPAGRPVWASLRCQAARLMVAEAEAPINPTNRRSSSTCTRTTWPAFAATLSPTASRRASSLTAHRDRATRCASTDPHGYCVMVAQIDDETIIGR